jgi:predicted RNase H-like nuclease (RuvC/YqgF family)
LVVARLSDQTHAAERIRSLEAEVERLREERDGGQGTYQRAIRAEVEVERLTEENKQLRGRLSSRVREVERLREVLHAITVSSPAHARLLAEEALAGRENP